MSGLKHPNFELLNRHNYKTWKSDIICLLEHEGVSKWVSLKTRPILPKEATFSDTLKYDSLKEKALGLIKSLCDHETRQIVENVEDPAEAWKALSAAFEATSRARKAHMLTEYMNVKLNGDEPMSIFIARFEAAYRRVEEAGESVSENQRCYQLIRYLPESYDGVVRELYECPDEQFNFSNVKLKLLSEYGRKSIKKEERELEENAYAIAKSSRQVTSKEEKRFPMSKTKEIKCFRCGKLNHMAKNCRSPLPQSRAPNKNSSYRKNSRANDPTKTYFVDIRAEEAYGVETRTREWTIDSATTSHIAQNPEFFVSMRQPKENSYMKMGNTPHKVEGIGTVKLLLRGGGNKGVITMINVLYVPSINRNLISVVKMEDAGLRATIQNGFRLYDGKKLMYTAHRENNFYTIRGIPVTTKNSSFAVETNSMMRWHERLGHCGMATIKLMANRNLVKGLDKLTGKEETCETCRLTKSTRATHPSLGEIQSKRILQLIHADVWGPAPVESLEGFRLVLTFIDDYSRRAFCYPLKSKEDVFEKIQEFITTQERYTNKKVAILRTDNGLEFVNSRVSSLLKKLGIKHQRTNTYSPQMNGLAERYNRTLIEGVRAHLESTGLPKYHWVEAIMSTNYLRNRIYHQTIRGIPFTKWYGNKPSVKHLKRLGCIAYVHIPKRKRDKFEKRGMKGVFVGYALQTRGYRIWLPETNKIIETKHVRFDENYLAKAEAPNERYYQFPPSGTTDEDWNFESCVPEKHLEDRSSTSPGEISFNRTWSERKKGDKRLDIYYKTSTGKTLRSRNDVRKFCEENKLSYNINDFNYSTKDKQEHTLVLKAKTGNEVEPEDDTAVEDTEPDNSNEDRKTSPEDEDDPESEVPEASCGELLGEAYSTDIKIPRSVKEALRNPEASKWKEAMDGEIQTMYDRKVWSLVPRPKDTKVIGCRWVYNLKKDSDGNIKTYKARLVALGNNQRSGLDYDETYSPVVNFSIIRLFILLFVVIFGWCHCMLDVKCAYLYGKMDKVQYMKQPEGYVKRGREEYVLKLHKAIYGLHQSGRLWYQEIHEKLLNLGFKEIQGMQCVYQRNGNAILQLYVDDITIYAIDQKELTKVTKLIESVYEVENLGSIKDLLGIKFDCSKGFATINQTVYIEKCLKTFNCSIFYKVYVPMTPGEHPSKAEMAKTEQEKFRMKDIPYRNLLGALTYIASRTRPDIAYSVACLSQFCESPGRTHWNKLRQILNYLGSTKELMLVYKKKDSPLQIKGYADSNWATDPDNRRSWSGYCIFVQDNLVTWRVVKQSCAAQSPMEAEYIAIAELAKEIKFLHTVFQHLQEIFHFRMETPIIFCDSSAAISFTKNKIQNVRTRYIDLKYHFVRELYDSGLFELKHVRTKENIADIFTKPLKRVTFESLRDVIVN